MIEAIRRHSWLLFFFVLDQGQTSRSHCGFFFFFFVIDCVGYAGREDVSICVCVSVMAGKRKLVRAAIVDYGKS